MAGAHGILNHFSKLFRLLANTGPTTDRHPWREHSGCPFVGLAAGGAPGNRHRSGQVKAGRDMAVRLSAPERVQCRSVSPGLGWPTAGCSVPLVQPARRRMSKPASGVTENPRANLVGFRHRAVASQQAMRTSAHGVGIRVNGGRCPSATSGRGGILGRDACPAELARGEEYVLACCHGSGGLFESFKDHGFLSCQPSGSRIRGHVWRPFGVPWSRTPGKPLMGGAFLIVAGRWEE